MLPAKATPKSTRQRQESTGRDQVLPSKSRGLRWYCQIVLAGFFFLLGVLGVFLPGLPATPFLLLTSYFLVRSSPRLNDQLLRSRLFGPVLVDWQVHGGIRPHIRVKAILAVIAAVGLTIYLSAYSALVSFSVIALAVIGMTVILRLPSASSKSDDHDSHS